MIGTKTNPFQRYTWRGTCVALLSVLTILLFAATASAQKSIIVSQATSYTAVPGGGVLGGEDPAGGSMAINSHGVIVAGDTYGGDIVEWAPPAYTATKISPAAGNNVSAIAIDSNGYLYIGEQYNNNIVKVPMNTDGTYTIATNPAGSISSLPACLGDSGTGTTDTAECALPAQSAIAGVSALAVDSKNNLYIATDDQTNSGAATPFSIFMCNQKCLYGSAPIAAVLLFSEPVNPVPATGGQYYIGSMAFDAFGNLFFTDSAEENGSLKSAASNLWEMPLQLSTKTVPTNGFNPTPQLIMNFTNATPANYDNAIDAVATDSQGHLAVSIIYSGIYALVDNGSLNANENGTATASTTGMVGLANQVQTKLMLVDNANNLWVIGNGTGGDTLSAISLNPTKFTGPVVVGTPQTANVVVADSTEACTPALTIVSSDPAFTATPGTCNNMYGVTGSFVNTAFTFTPTTTAFAAADLTITDTTSAATTQQTVASSGAVLTVSQSVWGASFTGGGAWSAASPAGSTAAVNSKGFMVVGNSYGGYVQEFSPGSINITSTTQTATNLGGKMQTPGAVAIDKNDNLYASSEISYNGSYPANTILKFPMNADGTYPPIPSSCTTQPCDALISALPACTGTSADSAGICQIVVGGTGLYFGVSGMIVDKNGNLFITTSNAPLPSGSSATLQSWSVLECGLTCLYGSSPTAPVVLWQEPTGAANKPQLNLGAIAIDSKENLFFVDSMIDPLASNMSDYSDVLELPYTGSGATGYAASPSNLQTLTPVCTSLTGCSYNNVIGTVATDKNDNVFYGTTFGGVYELANNSGTPIGIAGQSVKLLVPDPAAPGNFDFVSYNGGDTAGYIQTGAVALSGNASSKTPATGTAVALDNFGDCASGQGNLTVSAVNADFTGQETAGGTCGMLPLGHVASFPLTVSFTPTNESGLVSTTLTVTNAGTSDTGTATATAQASIAQAITFTNPAASESIAYTTTPIVLAATGGASGNPVTFAVGSGPGTLAADGITLTITGVGNVVINATQAGGVVSGTNYAVGSGSITITVTAAPQVITSTCAASVAYGTTAINLAACTTGGGGDQPVTYTLASGPTGTTVTTAGALTLGGVTPSGSPIVIDANQAASSNGDYAAATQLAISITVTPGAAVATPTISPASGVTLSIGNANNSVTLADATAGATIMYTTDGSDPATSSTATAYTAPFTLSTAGTATVTAIAELTNFAPSAEATATYTVTATAPGFTASSSGGTSAASPITITSNTPGTLTLTLTPAGGFNQAITFSCTASTGISVTCSFSPATVTPDGTDKPVTVTVTLTKSSTAFLQKGTNPFLPGGVTFALALGLFGWRKRRGLLLALLLVVGAVTVGQLTACGGSSSTTGTVTINAKAGSTTVPTVVNVVQK